MGNFRTALTRQITEAVRIRNRGKSVLNSKGEYDRCRIHRLTIGTDERSDGGITITEPESKTKEDMMGEHYLLGKRKELDRGRMKYTEDVGNTSRKRGNNDDVPMIGRPSKKRKFVLIGRGWGGIDDKGEKGLDVKRGAGPLNMTSGDNDQDLLSSSSGGSLNMNVNNTDRTGDASTIGEQESQEINKDQGRNVGTGPLLVTSNNVEDDVGRNTNDLVRNTNQNVRKTQLSITQFTTSKVERGDTTTVKERCNTNNDGNLYDTASNVSMLRDIRGNCVIRDGYCQEHNLEARKVTTVRSVWTRNNKTGVFGYRRRKVSTMRCNRHMGTLVDTMGARVGTGENTGAFTGTG